ncbi:hypothetical protein [Streptomyces liliifuscus]|uniref:Uncharacterized protein n=1 Tax=Streptomyces liliifuscus TaxID=2797636 RepID=A0A7T7L163_9ACTN|nr:hypothetical protein [Streptomyces liliifuscus]QQM44572.1 hypothetical protein JEQ17_37655 [Streptomyces liliifuscus]
MDEESLQGPSGRYRDVLVDASGRQVWCRDWRQNLILDGLRRLLAALMKGDPQGARLTHWAVGTGDPSWDAGAVPPEAARRTRSQLYTETARQSLTAGQITFVGGAFTNRLEITAQFTTADIPGGPATWSLREFGVFGGGTGAAGSGVLVNHRIHPRIDMQAGFSLQRTLRLTF